jgi:hypothetical protein
MATVEEIKAAAKSSTQWPGFHTSVSRGKETGVVLKFSEPVPLVVERDLRDPRGSFKQGETVYAEGVDISNQYAGTVHLRGRGFWWPVSMFSLSKDGPR